MKWLLTITFVLFMVFGFSQTVIEMMHAGDADVILKKVDNIEEADIVIYKTDEKEECQSWDCMWKFKKWGFANFSVYFWENELELFDEETGIKLVSGGNVYFTENKEERGYRKDILIQGVMKVKREK